MWWTSLSCKCEATNTITDAELRSRAVVGKLQANSGLLIHTLERYTLLWIRYAKMGQRLVFGCNDVIKLVKVLPFSRGGELAHDNFSRSSRGS